MEWNVKFAYIIQIKHDTLKKWLPVWGVSLGFPCSVRGKRELKLIQETKAPGTVSLPGGEWWKDENKRRRPEETA